MLPQLTENSPRRNYLVTYSRADHEKFSDEKSFGQAVALSFGDGRKVGYFASTKEKHSSADNDFPYHYHCAIHLEEPQRWHKSKKFFQEEFGIVPNFAEAPNGGKYIALYRYIKKENETDYRQTWRVAEQRTLPDLSGSSSSAPYFGARALRQRHPGVSHAWHAPE